MKYLVFVLFMVFGAASVFGNGLGLLDGRGASDVDGYIKMYEFFQWNDKEKKLDKFCHITYDPNFPTEYKIYNKDGQMVGTDTKPALNVSLPIGTHYFALKVTDNDGASSIIDMNKRLVLDIHDEWRVISVVPNPNGPPILYAENDLIRQRNDIVELWQKIRYSIVYYL